MDSEDAASASPPDKRCARGTGGAQPCVESAYHYDTEYFEIRMAGSCRADEMLARWLGAILTAHREFARRRGVNLPY